LVGVFIPLRARTSLADQIILARETFGVDGGCDFEATFGVFQLLNCGGARDPDATVSTIRSEGLSHPLAVVPPLLISVPAAATHT